MSLKFNVRLLTGTQLSGGNPIAVNIYHIISYHNISNHIISYMKIP